MATKKKAAKAAKVKTRPEVKRTFPPVIEPGDLPSRLPVKEIVIREQDNPRLSFLRTGEDWDAFKGSIETSGVNTPVVVLATKKGPVLIDGFRRITACLALIEGEKILGDFAVPVTWCQSDSKCDVLAAQSRANNGRLRMSAWATIRMIGSYIDAYSDQHSKKPFQSDVVMALSVAQSQVSLASHVWGAIPLGLREVCDRMHGDLTQDVLRMAAGRGIELTEPDLIAMASTGKAPEHWAQKAPKASRDEPSDEDEASEAQAELPSSKAIRKGVRAILIEHWTRIPSKIADRLAQAVGASDAASLTGKARTADA